MVSVLKEFSCMIGVAPLDKRILFFEKSGDLVQF